jgi:hypothetical protein
MFLAKGLGRMGRMGDFVNRSPDYKIDNWIGQTQGGTMAPVAASSVIPGVSNTTAAAVGIGGLAAAAALAYYLMK